MFSCFTVFALLLSSCAAEESTPIKPLETRQSVYVAERAEVDSGALESNCTMIDYQIPSKYCDIPMTLHLPMDLYQNGSFRQFNGGGAPFLSITDDPGWYVETVGFYVAPTGGGVFPSTELTFTYSGNLVRRDGNILTERVSFHEGGIIELYP